MTWVVDDQDNRFDGPVRIQAPSTIVHSLPFTTINNTYILLDTADPEFHIRYSRYPPASL